MTDENIRDTKTYNDENIRHTKTYDGRKTYATAIISVQYIHFFKIRQIIGNKFK
jgi:hypothetical protein